MQPNDQNTPFSPQEQAPEPQVSAPVNEQSPMQPTPETLQQTPVNDEATQQLQPTELPQPEVVSWQAIEYLQHDKSPLWYLGFGAVVIALIALSVFFQAWTFLALIIVMAVALVVYSHRPPRMLNYVWSVKGLYINDQLHPAGEFKSFGVVQDHDHHQLMLIPVKRFRPALAVYFPAEIGEQLVDAVGAYLPMQELHLDSFDKIVRKLRI